MDSSTRVVVNTGIQYVRTVVQVAIMLYTSRVVLDNLGVEDYGIYTVSYTHLTLPTKLEV